MRPEDVLIQYGLFALLLGAAIEGDISMVVGGAVAHLGYFRLPAAIGFAALGLFIGDCCWYALGRAHTQRFRRGRLYRTLGPKIERLANRMGVWELVAARFVYGTKIASMLFWGLHGLPFLRFAAVDGIGCLVGAAFFVGLGYAVGSGAEALLGNVKRLELALLAAVVVALVVLVLIRVFARRSGSVANGGE
jgi:membrane protein DedA with SNARE-associated domain